MAEFAYDLIVANGVAVLPDGERKLDIGIRDGRIAALADALAPHDAAQTLDAAGHWVLPGMIDAHVHFNEPGNGHWEGFASGSAALAAGGCTAYADMPLNGLPPTTDAAALRLKAAAAEGRSCIDYAFWGGVVPGNADKLRELRDAGAPVFKAFLSDPGGADEGRFREVDDWTLLEAMRTIAAMGGLLAVHAESGAITARLGAAAVAEGRLDARSYAASRPVIAELEAVNRMLLYAAHTGCRVHFVHMSGPEAVVLIADAKRRGLDVTAETCPHYLTLTEADMERLGPVAKCAPPLRSADSVERLWRLLADGAIDIVASDHSPCPQRMKSEAASFVEAWGGISGGQSSLELLLDEGAIRRGVPLARIAELTAGRPARLLGLDVRKGAIKLGMDADLAVIHPNMPYTLEQSHLYQRHPHSPYIGRTMRCRVMYTLCRGRVVYETGRGIVAPGHGVRLLPTIGRNVHV